MRTPCVAVGVLLLVETRSQWHQKSVREQMGLITGPTLKRIRRIGHARRNRRRRNPKTVLGICEINCLAGVEGEDQLQFGRPLHCKVGRFVAIEDAIDRTKQRAV